MKKYPKVSIIIPLYVKTAYFFESVEKCLKLDYPDFEILVGVDKKMSLNFTDSRIRVLETGQSRTGPAEKRDIGIRKAKGDLIAFLDDDSYPDKNWLKNAVKVMQKMKVESVCGPGLTPPKDSFSQKITGAILSTYIGTGPYAYRFTKQAGRFVDDYPAYNLLVNKKDLLEIGGFNNKFYGGEDTALCLKLIRQGKRIYYDPEIVVYHHRRDFPSGYLKQVGNVGLHRGYFVKAYPETSLRLSYFMPSFGVAAVLMSFLAMLVFSSYRLEIVVILCSLYLIGILDSLRTQSILISVILPVCVFLSHVSYAYQFLKGLLFTRKLLR